MVRNIPHLALIPFVILWFGIGGEAKVFLVALGSSRIWFDHALRLLYTTRQAEVA